MPTPIHHSQLWCHLWYGCFTPCIVDLCICDTKYEAWCPITYNTNTSFSILLIINYQSLVETSKSKYNTFVSYQLGPVPTFKSDITTALRLVTTEFVGGHDKVVGTLGRVVDSRIPSYRSSHTTEYCMVGPPFYWKSLVVCDSLYDSYWVVIVNNMGIPMMS